MVGSTNSAKELCGRMKEIVDVGSPAYASVPSQGLLVSLLVELAAVTFRLYRIRSGTPFVEGSSMFVIGNSNSTYKKDTYSQHSYFASRYDTSS